MNTLSKKLTARFFLNSEGYQMLRDRWSKLMNSPEKVNLAPEHHLLYHVLIGKDWRKAFTMMTNINKCACQGTNNSGRAKALNVLYSKTPATVSYLLQHSGDLLVPNVLELVRDVLPYYSNWTEKFTSPEAYPNVPDLIKL